MFLRSPFPRQGQHTHFFKHTLQSLSISGLCALSVVRSPGLGSGLGHLATSHNSRCPPASHPDIPVPSVPGNSSAVLHGTGTATSSSPSQKHSSAGMGNQPLSVHAVSGPWEACRHHHWTRCGVEVLEQAEGPGLQDPEPKPHEVPSTPPRQSARTTGSPGPANLYRDRRENLLSH